MRYATFLFYGVMTFFVGTAALAIGSSAIVAGSFGWNEPLVRNVLLVVVLGVTVWYLLAALVAFFEDTARRALDQGDESGPR